MDYLRAPSPVLPLLTALALLSACPGPATEDGSSGETGDGDGDGDPQACIDPGSELLPAAKPAPLPGPNSPAFTCGTGWGTDAPRRDASWTVQLGDTLTDFFAPPLLEAHPDGGVAVYLGGELSRVDADGETMWSTSVGPGEQGQYTMTVEAAGTVVVGVYDWNQGQTTVTRYAADGSALGEIAVPWNSVDPSLWGLATFGSDLVIAAFDEDDEGSYENTLLRLDAMDAVALRKSTNLANGQILAVNDDGVVMFGSQPGFLVSLDNGAVLGNLQASNGFPSEVAGGGTGFYMGGSANGDFMIGRYTGVGSELWQQTYDRAGLGDQARAIAVGADGTVVAAGNTQLLDFSDVTWFGSQPMVMATNADGDALWTDRISTQGDAMQVAISGTGVYVSGLAELDSQPAQDPQLIAWLRKYEL